MATATVSGEIINRLPNLVAALRYAISREATYPARPELYGRLREIEEAAQLLRKELPDLHIRAILLDGDPYLENENEMYHGLADIAARSEAVRVRTPPTQGRGQLHSTKAGGPNAQELCALIIEVVWEATSGRWPGAENKKAHNLCQKLWEAAGGPKRPGWNVAGWRNHLKKVASMYRPPHPAGEHIRNMLSAQPETLVKFPRPAEQVAPSHSYETKRTAGTVGSRKEPFSALFKTDDASPIFSYAISLCRHLPANRDGENDSHRPEDQADAQSLCRRFDRSRLSHGGGDARDQG